MEYIINPEAKRIESAVQRAQEVADGIDSEAIVVKAILDVIQHGYKKDVIMRRLLGALTEAYAL